MNRPLKYSLVVLLLFILFLTYNAIVIHRYSESYLETKSDVAIVLGAGTKGGKLSAIFRERINHSIYLIQDGRVDNIIFTGGIGKNQMIADSEIAKRYAISNGISADKIFIEKKSITTFSNLEEAKVLMETKDWKTALLVSDPLHMKRSMAIADRLDIKCNSSPTQTTMYKTWITKLKSMIYESFFFSIGFLTGRY